MVCRLVGEKEVVEGREAAYTMGCPETCGADKAWLLLTVGMVRVDMCIWRQ